MPTPPGFCVQIAPRIPLLAAQASRRTADRAAMARWREPYGEPEPWDLAIDDLDVPGPHGPVRARVYRPAGTAPASGRPCLVWVHGGAFVQGTLDMPEAHEVARGVAGRAGAVVVSVEYRLADPEPSSYPDPVPNRFGDRHVTTPVPQDDVEATYRWVVTHADRLGVDTARVALGGASAGACLAAVVALRLAVRGDGPWQSVLVYPLLHAVLPRPTAEEARAAAAVPPVLSFPADLVRAINENVTGRPVEQATADDFPALAAPAALATLPPTLVEVAELDDLRPSGRAWVEALRSAGVDVDLVVNRGVPHGYLDTVGLEPARATLDRLARRLARPAAGPTVRPGTHPGEHPADRAPGCARHAVGRPGPVGR